MLVVDKIDVLNKQNQTTSKFLSDFSLYSLFWIDYECESSFESTLVLHLESYSSKTNIYIEHDPTTSIISS